MFELHVVRSEKPTNPKVDRKFHETYLGIKTLKQKSVNDGYQVQGCRCYEKRKFSKVVDWGGKFYKKRIGKWTNKEVWVMGVSLLMYK